MATFTDLVGSLAAQKRRAKLQGRPLSETEIRGTTAGYFDVASSRLAMAKNLAQQKEQHAAGIASTERLQAERLEKEETLQAQRLAEQKRIEAERLAEQKRAEQARLAEAEATRKEQMRVAEEAGEVSTGQRVAGSGVGAIGGAVAAGSLFGEGGALVGTGIAPGVGTVIGAFLGAIAGFFGGGGCLIVSACTDAFSYEVKVAREYRDKYMGPITLSGYYTIASMVVPFIKKYPWFKRFIKRYLVDRLVDYGEWVLEYKPEMKFRSSKPITRGFLRLCKFAGLLTIKEVECYG